VSGRTGWNQNDKNNICFALDIYGFTLDNILQVVKNFLRVLTSEANQSRFSINQEVRECFLAAGILR